MGVLDKTPGHPEFIDTARRDNQVSLQVMTISTATGFGSKHQGEGAAKYNRVDKFHIGIFDHYCILMICGDAETMEGVSNFIKLRRFTLCDGLQN